LPAKIIDGKSIAAEIREEVKKEVLNLKAGGIVPGLATLLVGENPASQIYLRGKHKACAEAGIASFNHVMPKDSDTSSVLKKVNELNSDPGVHGILVQLPLPPQVNTDQVLAALDPGKDADGFHFQNLGRLVAAKDMREITAGKNPIPIPCTPQGVIALIERTGVPIRGKNALVAGRSMIVGKPTAILLLANHATVTLAHSQTKNLVEYCLRADILIAAIGKPGMITSDMVKKGAVVIDVGINRNPDGTISGDVDFESTKAKAGWITPVPGGVGPMTIAMLLKNTVLLARNTLFKK
jgi:methylenetetrahydrofolate dehydrogenase (NADP+)/methenyltetrahydrofolate cyclohydrolase